MEGERKRVYQSFEADLESMKEYYVDEMAYLRGNLPREH